MIFLVCSSIAVRRETARGRKPVNDTQVARMKIKTTTAIVCVSLSGGLPNTHHEGIPSDESDPPCNNLSKNLSILRNKAKPWRWLENGRYANEKRSS